MHSSKMSKTAKFAIRATHDFNPVFYESLVVDSQTHTLCNGSRQCIYDTLVTGLLSVGLSSIDEARIQNKALQIIGKLPFRHFSIM